MPFDCAPEPSRPVNREVEVIEKMLAMFGPNGERWIQPTMHVPGRGWCLEGAAIYAAPNDDRLRVRVLIRLRDAIPHGYPAHVVGYNDNCSTTFAAIKALPLRARQAAMMASEAAGWQCAER